MRAKMAWLNSLSEASAGALGQLFSTLLLYPLDTSKTRVQACMDSGSPGGSGEGKRASGGKAGSGAGGKKKAKAVPWQEWFLSLYTGIETKALQTLVSQFLFFYTYEYIKRKVKGTGRQINAFDNVLIGMLAGSVNVLITQPLDTYVTMKQSKALLSESGDDDEDDDEDENEKDLENGQVREAKKKRKEKKEEEEEAKIRPYAALGPSLFLSINPGLQYAIFDQVKGVLMRRRAARANAAAGGGGRGKGGTSLSAFDAFILGAISKCIATVVTYPAIRGKVVCQSVHGSKYAGLADAMTKIVQSEGSSGLYKGLPQQLTKTVLSAAIGLMLKEKISQAEKTFAATILKMASKQQ